MCDVICVNMKCDRRLPTGFCGRAYPCSECQTIVSAEYLHELEEIPEMTYEGTSMSKMMESLLNQEENSTDELQICHKR